MTSPDATPSLSPPAVVGNAIVLPITVDPDLLTAEAFAYLQAVQPGWMPHEGQLDVRMIEVFARMVAAAARTMATVPLAIFQYLGQQLHNIPPLPGAAAAMDVVFTAVDDLGHTIPAGTQVLLPVGPGADWLFLTTADAVIANGSTQVQTTVSAADVGAGPNGVPAPRLLIVDALAWLEAVVCIDAPQAPYGGADAETIDVYLSRLRRELALLTPRPILPADFAAIALNQDGVARAVALDGYNPQDGSTGNPLTVAVCAVDAAGQTLTPDAQDQLQATLNATRGVNWQVTLMAPSYTPINVSAQVSVQRGRSLNTVQAAATAAVTNYLSPRYWGGSVDANGALTADWINTTTVRQLGIVGALSQVPGVAYISGVQLSGNSDGLAVNDVQLTGAVPLPLPGVVSVVANFV